jgi:hypothetical protein
MAVNSQPGPKTGIPVIAGSSPELKHDPGDGGGWLPRCRRPDDDRQCANETHIDDATSADPRQPGQPASTGASAPLRKANEPGRRG